MDVGSFVIMVKEFLASHLLLTVLMAALLALAFLLALLFILRYMRVSAHGSAERVLKRNEELVALFSEKSGPVTTDAVNRLKEIGSYRDIELVLEKAASLSGRSMDHFKSLFDKVGITDRYMETVKSSVSWKQRAFAAEQLGLIGSPKAVPTLLAVVKDTKDEDEDVRAVALRALGRIRDKRAVPFLVEALGSPETWLPPRIGEILVNIGEPSVRDLIRSLKDYGNDTSRAWSAEILGWIEAKEAAPSLMEALFDVNPEVRAKAVGALGKIKDDRAVSKMTELLISDPAPFVRVRTAKALGEIGHPAVIDYLINILKDPEWWVRVRAVEALEQLGDRAVSGLLIALEESDLEVSRRAAMALERIGYVAKILDEYGETHYRADIKHVLFRVARTGVIESMSDRLMTSPPQLTKSIVRLFGEAETKEASEPLLELLSRTSDWTIKARIIEALGKIGAREAIPHLIGYLKGNEYWVRKSAVVALGKLDAQESVGAIAKIMGDPNHLARESAVVTLVALNVRKYRKQMVGLLDDPSPPVRATALMALRKLRLAAGKEKVGGLLKDPADKVRVEGIRYFAAIREEKAFDDIICLLPHGSDEVRREVVNYVGVLPGIHFKRVVSLLAVDELSSEATASLCEIASTVRGNGAYRFIVAMTKGNDPALRARAISEAVKFNQVDNSKLFEKGFFDPSATVRITALAGMSAGSAPPILKKAAPLGKDPDENVRAAFALAVGASEAGSFKGAVTEMLDDPSLRVVSAAVMTLASFDNQVVMKLFSTKQKMERIKGEIGEINKEPRYRPMVETVRSRARKKNNLVVRLLLTPSEREYTADLISLLKESINPAHRAKIMEILKFVDVSEFYTLILGFMKKDPSTAVRLKAMDVVTSIKRDAEIVSILSSMLFDPALNVRCGAATALMRYKHPKSVEALLHALDTSDRQFREAVTTSLAHLLSENPQVMDALLKSTPATVTKKIGMTWLMGKSKQKGTLQFLMKQLDDVNADVRASTVGAIGKFRRKQLLNSDDTYLFNTFLGRLEKCVFDPNERVRAAAVNAITAIGGDKAFGIVASALDDGDEFVRGRAALGMARLNTKRAVALLEEKARHLPIMGSYARGIAYAAGRTYDTNIENDEAARKMVAELCPREKMYHRFTSSNDKKTRLHAFRVLTLLGGDTLGDLKNIALNDPLPEVRSEAARYFKAG